MVCGKWEEKSIFETIGSTLQQKENELSRLEVQAKKYDEELKVYQAKKEGQDIGEY